MSRKSQKNSAKRPTVESLENRELLAADGSFIEALPESSVHASHAEVVGPQPDDTTTTDETNTLNIEKIASKKKKRHLHTGWEKNSPCRHKIAICWTFKKTVAWNQPEGRNDGLDSRNIDAFFVGQLAIEMSGESSERGNGSGGMFTLKPLLIA